ncbi:uncharacterized protein LOC26515325 [Drosophila ananassae]|uniref:uncharacterized protein LOC26515325 n=1 Tax=Drosophila ananassae TaxID=7217 RepID=UPI0013A5D491|nr:uncharacterized protein LOC26515325 [Drosophila ananassae]
MMCNCTQAAVMAAAKDANENSLRYTRSFTPAGDDSWQESLKLQEHQQLKLSAAFRLHCISVSTQ